MDDHISDRDHVACDLKWRHATTWGIIIFFPRCNSFHFSKSLFSGMMLFERKQREIHTDLSKFR